MLKEVINQFRIHIPGMFLIDLFWGMTICLKSLHVIGGGGDTGWLAQICQKVFLLL